MAFWVVSPLPLTALLTVVWPPHPPLQVHDVKSADEEAALRKQAPTTLGKGRRDKATNALKHTLKRAYTVRLALGDSRVVASVLPFGTGGGGALLRAAAQRGSYRLVRKLLDTKDDGGANVSVDEATLRAETAMHLAASGKTDNHAEVCRMLRKAGADSFAPSMDGFRAYDSMVRVAVLVGPWLATRGFSGCV